MKGIIMKALFTLSLLLGAAYFFTQCSTGQNFIETKTKTKDDMLEAYLDCLTAATGENTRAGFNVRQCDDLKGRAIINDQFAKCIEAGIAPAKCYDTHIFQLLTP